MKTAKIIALTFLSLFLLNLISFWVFGKQSLRNRNVHEIIANGFEGMWGPVEEHCLLSNLNYQHRFEVDGKFYPIFQIDKNGKLDEDEKKAYHNFADSTFFVKSFNIDSNTANLILHTNLKSLSDDSLYLIIYQNSETLLRAMPDSLGLIPNTSNYRVECGYEGKRSKNTGYIHCMIWANTIGVLIEELHHWKPMYVEQEITAYTLGSDYSGDYRIERLLWLFFRWVQIDWIDGNGLNGDELPPLTYHIHK